MPRGASTYGDLLTQLSDGTDLNVLWDLFQATDAAPGSAARSTAHDAGREVDGAWLPCPGQGRGPVQDPHQREASQAGRHAP